MIQLTQAEYDTLKTQAQMYRDLMEKIADIRDIMSGAMICTGPAQSMMVRDAIQLIDALPRFTFGGYDPSFVPGSNPENPQEQ